jgi:hypothetical protein
MVHNKFLQAAVLLLVLFTFIAAPVSAQSNRSFSLQVTPSPLVLSVKPGETFTTELKIRNNGEKTEQLKIEPRSFNINGDTGEVALSDGTPGDINNWIAFADPTFTILPGQWFTQRITIKMPKDAGFSYSFALVISRASDATTLKPGETNIKGSVAVFTLIAVDRPGAKREVSVTNFAASKRVYEYLPTEFKTTLKNSGNTIVQPYGNIFIQRSGSSKNAISTLPVNEGKGYILPGSSRTLTSSWDEGFPVYKTTKLADNSQPVSKLTWEWNKLSDFRFGRYTAKLVAVYNDGTRDVPIEAETTFYVIPWKILIGVMLVIGLIGIGIFTLVKKSVVAIKRPKKKQHTHEKSDQETS